MSADHLANLARIEETALVALESATAAFNVMCTDYINNNGREWEPEPNDPLIEAMIHLERHAERCVLRRRMAERSNR